MAAALTLGCTATVGLGTDRVDGVTWSGAVAFGSVVGLTFLLVAALAVGLAQIVPTAGGARILGFAAVGAAFVLRSTADSRHAGWLNWLSPLGLRATVRPFSGNRWWVLAAYLVVAVAVAWFALILHDRRDYRAGVCGHRGRDVRPRSARPAPHRPAPADVAGALLVTAGMLVLLFALVKAPDKGWLTRHTIGELATAAVLLTGFVVVELRQRHPLFPFAILRTRGLAAADLTQLLAFAGFISTFFFLTLYMQNVLGFTPVQAGAAYLPVTAGIVVAAGTCGQLIPRTGTWPLIVAGALLAAAGMFFLARVPADGTYVRDLLPGLLAMSLGLGALFVTVTAAANAGVTPDQAGMAAALINTSLQLGSALGLAVFSALATARTNDAAAAGMPLPSALTAGFHRALLGAATALLLAAVVAIRALNTRRPDPTAAEPAPTTA